jgi:hypothetical protein
MPTGRGTRIERAEQHASDAPKPAVLLDIDGTSLSNWPAIPTRDYAFIKKGTCAARTAKVLRVLALHHNASVSAHSSADRIPHLKP